MLTRYLPTTVKKVAIEFSDRDEEEEQQINISTTAIARNKNSGVASSSSSNLEMVVLDNYAPAEENEIVYLMERFTGLGKLNICGNRYNTPIWPTEIKFSNNRMISFFKFLYGLPQYSFLFNVNDSSQVLRNYCHAHNTSISSGFKQNYVLEIHVEDNGLFHSFPYDSGGTQATCFVDLAGCRAADKQIFSFTFCISSKGESGNVDSNSIQIKNILGNLDNTF